MENHSSRKNQSATIERNNFDWEVGITKAALKLIGLWPGGRHQTVVFIVNQFMQDYLFGIFLASIILEPSMAKKIDKIFAWTGVLLTVTDHNCFRSQRCNIKPLIECIQQNWREFHGLSADVKTIMISYGALQRRITRCLYFTLGVSLIVFTLQPILLHFTFPSKFPLEHPNDPRHPFNATVLPAFVLAYIIQCVFHCSAALIFSSIDCCIIWLIFHCCGQLEILATVMNQHKGIRHHTSDSVDDGERVIMGCNCLHCIIGYHLQILKIISLFDDSFHMIMFARMMICTIHFICIGYTILKLKDDGNFGFLLVHVFYLITMNSSFFIYCWLGDKLKEKSGDVAQTAFLQYVFEKKRICKDLIMIIRQAQMRPCSITAAKFFDMSLELFKEYIFKSLSYLSVLIALKANDKS